MPKATINYPSSVVNRNGNGGWHPKGKRAYRKAVLTVLQCLQTYKEARLYHLCFEGKSHKKQVKMLNALVQMADRAGIKCEWFAARETADRTKVDHIHCFMVIDAYGIKVAKVFNQFDDGQVAQLCATHGVNFSIFSPKDDLGIHGRNTYMALPYQGPGNRETELGRKRLADGLVWLTYNYKARSKPLEEEADGQIFPASRPNRMRKAAPTQPKEDAMTPAPVLAPSTPSTGLPVALLVTPAAPAAQLARLVSIAPRTKESTTSIMCSSKSRTLPAANCIIPYQAYRTLQTRRLLPSKF